MNSSEAKDWGEARGLNPRQFGSVPSQLYHGTSHVFQPGDLVKSGRPSNFPDKTMDTEARHVFATGNLMEAHHFARNAERNAFDSADSAAGAHVYEVRPTGRMTLDKESLTSNEGDKEGATVDGSWQSRQPLKVVRDVTGLARREYISEMGEDIKEED